MEEEILAQIKAPHFTAGVVLKADRVFAAANIVRYMERQKWNRDRVRDYCRAKGWHISIVQIIKA